MLAKKNCHGESISRRLIPGLGRLLGREALLAPTTWPDMLSASKCVGGHIEGEMRAFIRDKLERRPAHPSNVQVARAIGGIEDADESNTNGVDPQGANASSREVGPGGSSVDDNPVSIDRALIFIMDAEVRVREWPFLLLENPGGEGSGRLRGRWGVW